VPCDPEMVLVVRPDLADVGYGPEVDLNQGRKRLWPLRAGRPSALLKYRCIDLVLGTHHVPLPLPRPLTPEKPRPCLLPDSRSHDCSPVLPPDWLHGHLLRRPRT